jgi:nitroreductase
MPVDTFLAIASRRDERRYRPDPLPDEVTARLLDAGRLSGSSKNSQPWTFVVPGGERVRALAQAVWVPENVRSAGLVVAIVVPAGRAAFDAGRAAQNILLAAWNEGLSSCPNGVRDQDAARAALELVEDEDVAIVLSFGRPEHVRDPESRSAEDWSGRANRRPLDEVVRTVG